MSEWISVEDRLPERSGDFIVYLPGRIDSKIDFLWFNHKLNGFYQEDELDAVTKYITHWMELPPPPL